MKKKVFVLLMVFVLVVSGCTSGNESSTTQNPENQGASNEQSTEDQNQVEENTAEETNETNATYTIVTIPKLVGIGWFDRMEEGVNWFAQDTGHDVYQTGPTEADPALQVQFIEDAIAQGVDAICVVPFSVEAVEPVLKKAREQGIVVVTHEASSIENADYDVEAFVNTEYGAEFMKRLAEGMGEEGEYTTFVGSLTSKTHNEWVDGSTALQEEAYPNMMVVSNKNESNDDILVAYNKTKELLNAYPNLKGIQGSAGTDVAGAAQAVEDLGLSGKLTLVGTSVPSASAKYIDNDTISSIGFWDPAEAGYVMNQVAVAVLEGRTIEDGHDFERPGYTDISLDGNVIYGSAWVFADKSNVHDFTY